MNLVAIMDLAGGLVLLVSVVLMLRNWKALVRRAEKVLIVFLIALGALFVNLGNFLEWAGITGALDPFEDYLQILIVALWGFVFVSILYERAQKAAWISESRFQNLLAHTVDSVFLHDAEGRILDANTQACESLGYSRDELLELKVGDVDISESASEEELQNFWEGVRSKERSTVQGLHRRKDGSTFPVEIRVGYLPSEDQELFVAIARDITDREIAERALRKSEEKYRFLSDNNLVGVYMIESGTFTYVNRKFCEIFGYSEEELVGRMNPLDLAHPDDRPIAAENIQRRADREIESINYQVRCIRKDGAVIIVEIFGSTVGEERKAAVQGAVVDITEHVEKDRMLQESEEQYRFLADNVSDVIWILDLDFSYKYISPSVERFRGVTAEEVMTQSVEEAMTPESLEMVRMALADELAQEGTEGVDPKRSRTLELEYLNKDGHTVWGEVTASLLRNENGEVNGILGTTRDIGERKQAEKALLDSEKRYRTLFKDNPMPITVADMKTRSIIDVNDAMVQHYGYTKDEFIGMTIRDLHDPSDHERLEEVIPELPRGRNITEGWKHRTKDGSIIDVETISHEITFKEKAARLVVINDVTEKVKAEAAYRASENKFRTAFRTSPDAITISRMKDGRFVDINDGFTALTGYDKSEVIGVSSLEIDIWADPEDRQRLLDGLKNKGMVNNLEVDFRSKDGSILPSLLSAKIIDMDGEPHILIHTRVITDLKKAEEKIKSSLEEKEVLLKEIHHRVKNNLQVISGLLNLQAHHITDEKGREIYKESQNRVISMALIHEELYQAKDLARVDFADYIRNLAENLFASYGMTSGNVNLVLETDEMDMVVDTAIPCGLIINELISNSLKHAFPNGSKGEIRVSFHETAEGEYELFISDNGIGLPEGLDIQKTSSLGMQLVTVLANQLGGELSVRSDEGTEFSIRFKEYLEAGTILY